MEFSAYLPWQKPLWQRLTAMPISEVSHAWIFYGAQGIGKTSFVRAWLQRLICTEVANDALACGECRACRLLRSGNHPDVHILKSEDETTIKVDAVRLVLQALGQTPHSAPFTIVLLEQAHKLHISAANALLKSLEEPSGQTLWLLTTEALTTVPATIRSRCQKQLIASPEMSDARSWLQTQLPEYQNIDALLALAHGAPLKARHLASEDKVSVFDRFKKDFQALFHDNKNHLTFAEHWSKQELSLLLDWTFLILKELLVTNVSQNNIKIIKLLLCIETFWRESKQSLFKKMALNTQMWLEKLVYIIRSEC